MNSAEIVMQLDRLKSAVGHRNVVLFGAGGTAYPVIQLCHLLNLTCLFIVDNDSAKWNQRFLDRYDIKQPDELLNNRHDIMILVASIYYDEISAQLEAMGFVAEIDFINVAELQMDKGLCIFSNEYSTFDVALRDSTGYEVNEYKEAAMKNLIDFTDRLNTPPIRLNQDEQQYLLAVSLATQNLWNHASLRVLDFGGALGEHYFLAKKYFMDLPIEDWTVCETKMMADTGNEIHPIKNVRFISDIRSAAVGQFDLVIASGSLQFVDSPDEYYFRLTNLNSKYIFITRFPLINRKHDILTKLTVPPHLFNASYPSWIFSTSKWIHTFQDIFDIVASWENHEVYYYKGKKISFQGFLLKRKCH